MKVQPAAAGSIDATTTAFHFQVLMSLFTVIVFAREGDRPVMGGQKSLSWTRGPGGRRGVFGPSDEEGSMEARAGAA